MQEILRRCKLLEYRFGFLGEIYVKPEMVLKLDDDLVEKYFSWKEPYFCSRNSHYYRADFNITMGYIFEYHDDINEIIELNTDEEQKRCILFCVLAHLMNDISKLMGGVFVNRNYRHKYYRSLKDLLQTISDYCINLIFGGDILQFTHMNLGFFEMLYEEVSIAGGLAIREYSEMDHPLLLIMSYLVYYDYIKDISLFIAPLQGASLIPPIYVSLAKLLNPQKTTSANLKIEYLRHSNYDCFHQLDFDIKEQVDEIIRFNGNVPAMLIDDNVGTGATIENLLVPLRSVFDHVLSGVVECRWDVKINEQDYPAFDINMIDIITPLEYRHYGIFEEMIAYVKLEDKLNPRYKSDFYCLELIYDECDFISYLKNSGIEEENKTRLMEIISKYKVIQAKN